MSIPYAEADVPVMDSNSPIEAEGVRSSTLSKLFNAYWH
jgi:hypothetical protein